MKKAMLMILLFAGISFSSAQVEKQDDRQENILDKIEQEPQRPTQVRLERASKIEAQRIHAEKKDEKRAEKKAKRLARKLAREKARQPSVRQE
ncbi:hypothetical protein [Flavobacterium sp.]|jgi:hypothetical protein|uniref:hypothetical protein n=1 Tax=Flavobacterium sp. TaxID=239 RepID=UPI0037C08D85